MAVHRHLRDRNCHERIATLPVHAMLSHTRPLSPGRRAIVGVSLSHRLRDP